MATVRSDAKAALVHRAAADEGVAEPAEVIEPAADESVADAAVAAEPAEWAGSMMALADGSQPEGYDIKGNADSMLYHTPGSSFYNRTKAEVWFDTEANAEAAGFSKPASQQKDSE